MTNGRLTLTEGLLSARLEVNAHTDAAVSGAIAGLELEVVDAAVSIGPQSSYRAATTVSLTMHPGTMESLLMLLADRLDLPAFTEHEWRQIAAALDFAAAKSGRVDFTNMCRLTAERIRSAYSS